MNTRSVRGLVGLMIFASLAGISRAEVPKLIKDSTQEKIFKVIVHSKIKPFFVHLIYDVSEPKYPVVEKLEVYDVHKQLIQVLPVEMIEPPYEDAEFFLIEDMNFDGYKDLELLVSWGVTGNESYQFWLFDPRSRKFNYNEQLSSFGSPSADEDKKLIYSWWNGGSVARIYQLGVYKWEDNKLILIREAEEDEIEGTDLFHKTIKELRNGKLEIVSDRVLTDEEASQENQEGTQLEY